MNPPGPSGMKEDARLVLSPPDGKSEAWLWWQAAPALENERVGVIGHFSADSAASAREVLEAANARLRAEGCTLAVGPMNGNTWRSYRFVTDPGTAPPFFLEPSQPPLWPRWWQDAGFTPLADYYSTITDDLSRHDERVDAVSVRLRASGVELRPLNLVDFAAELERIYDVSLVSFQRNFLYTPLAKAEFLAQFEALRGRVNPELVVLAEKAGNVIGYVFATPDFAEIQRSGTTRTIIVKTLAVLPGRSYAGLGAWLLSEVHAAAQRLGFTQAIHALMHESNASRNLSAHYAKLLRRYTLFGKSLRE